MTKRNITIVILLITIFIILPIVLFLLSNKALTESKVVVIDNSSDHSKNISSSAFSNLGSFLYNFINNPDQEIYHGTIKEGSYSYSSSTWFSRFIVELNNSDVSWNVQMQTLKTGELNGNISVSCNSGGEACLSVSAKSNPTATLQSYLPLNTNDYIISFNTNDINVLSVVYYDQEGVGKSKALEKITSLGFNPEDYTINYYYGGH